MCNCFAFGKKICYNYDMNVNEKKSERVLSAIDTAVFVITAAVFAFCLVYATVSMITGKESPIYSAPVCCALCLCRLCCADAGCIFRPLLP